MAKPKKLVKSSKAKPRTPATSAKPTARTPRLAKRAQTEARGTSEELPPLPAIRPAPSTGDEALDDRLHAVTTGSDQATTAIDLLATDARPEVTHALRERITALCEAITAEPVLPRSKRTRKLEATYSERLGELEARTWRLSWTFEALAAHRDAGSEMHLLAIWRAHPNPRVRAAAGKALLGFRFSKQTDARPYDPRRRASRGTLEQMVATLDDPTPGAEIGELRNVAAEAMYLLDPDSAPERFAPWLDPARAEAERRAVDEAPDLDDDDRTPAQPVYAVGKALWTHLQRPITAAWRERFEPLRDHAFWFAQLLAT